LTSFAEVVPGSLKAFDCFDLFAKDLGTVHSGCCFTVIVKAATIAIIVNH